MPRLDDYPLDPDIAAALDAIDATLAGEPVDPRHAEIAELALLLADQRPEVDPAFARSLDERVARRFAPRAAETSPRRGRRWIWKSLAATLAAGFAAVVAVVMIGSGGGGSSLGLSTMSKAPAAVPSLAPPAAAHQARSSAAPGSSASTTASGSSASTTASGSSASTAASGSSASTAASGSSASTAASGSGSAPAPQPPSNGRKVIQSAELTLSTAPNRVEDVAQEVFDVIGRQSGVVDRSTVTATGGTDGYAQFELRVPSGSLSTTMNLLSRLRYAHVSSRTDDTQDVNDAYVSATHRLADARALRAALLRQLATAVTQQQIDSINGRIHDAEASIARDEAAIRSLNRRINFSQITLSIDAANAPAPAAHHSGSFTLGQATHDAGRVLTVAAGVALIGLAVLVPLTLVGALVAWIAIAIRHRRREQALDAA